MTACCCSFLERSASHSFRFFSFFVCFIFVRRENFRFCSRVEREVSNFCVTERRKKDGIKEKKGVGMGRNEQILSLSERTNTISHHFSRQIIKEWD